MKRSGWTIGHIADAPILITPSWFVAAAFLTVLFAWSIHGQAFAQDFSMPVIIAVSLAFVLLLFGSVFCHEAAHALMAKRRGHTVTEVAVTLWGGHTQYTGRATHPDDVALVSVVGPLTNVVLATLFWVLQHVLPGGSIPALLAFAAFFSNVFVGAFNLLPGLPLDGGQILEAIVWRATGWRSRGTLVAGWTGRILAIVVVVAVAVWVFTRSGSPDYTNLLWAAFVGFFLWSGAGEAIRAGEMREKAGQIDARTMATRCVMVRSGRSMADAARAASGVEAAAVVVADPQGHPKGWVSASAAAKIPEDKLASTPVDAAMVPFPEGCDVDVALAGTPLLDHLVATANDAKIVPVVDNGAVVGVLDVARVAERLRAGGAT
jgi:Zn-dependent protease